jgi:hypothetical protein
MYSFFTKLCTLFTVCTECILMLCVSHCCLNWTVWDCLSVSGMWNFRSIGMPELWRVPISSFLQQLREYCVLHCPVIIRVISDIHSVSEVALLPSSGDWLSLY